MKVYRVKLLLETVVCGKDKEAALIALKSEWKEICKTELSEIPLCSVAESAVVSNECKRIKDLPQEWTKSCIPWGSLENKTLGELLKVGKE